MILAQIQPAQRRHGAPLRRKRAAESVAVQVHRVHRRHVAPLHRQGPREQSPAFWHMQILQVGQSSPARRQRSNRSVTLRVNSERRHGHLRAVHVVRELRERKGGVIEVRAHKDEQVVRFALHPPPGAEVRPIPRGPHPRIGWHEQAQERQRVRLLLGREALGGVGESVDQHHRRRRTQHHKQQQRHRSLAHPPSVESRHVLEVE